MTGSEKTPFANPNYIRPDILKPDSKEITKESTGMYVLDAVEISRKKLIAEGAETARLEIESARFEAAQARLDSLYDPITGIFNVRCFTEEKQRLNSEHDYSENDIAIVFIDLNDFGEVNKKVGQDAGDELLKQIAQYLHHNTRSGDIVFRIGGDEFAIICHNDRNTKYFEANLQVALEKKLSQIQDCPIKYPGGSASVTFAWGCAVFDGNQDQNLDDTQRRADELMRQNKVDMKTVGSQPFIVAK